MAEASQIQRGTKLKLNQTWLNNHSGFGRRHRLHEHCTALEEPKNGYFSAQFANGKTDQLTPEEVDLA
jgi:hypothetical protein